MGQKKVRLYMYRWRNWETDRISNAPSVKRILPHTIEVYRISLWRIFLQEWQNKWYRAILLALYLEVAYCPNSPVKLVFRCIGLIAWFRRRLAAFMYTIRRHVTKFGFVLPRTIHLASRFGPNMQRTCWRCRESCEIRIGTIMSG